MPPMSLSRLVSPVLVASLGLVLVALPQGQARPQDVLEEARARRAIAEQKVARSVDEVIRQANLLVVKSPDDAHDLLKRALEAVRSDADIGETARAAVAGRVERSLQ